MSATIIAEKYKGFDRLPPEYFAELAEFRKTPIGAAVSEFYDILHRNGPKLGREKFCEFENVMSKIEKEIAVLISNQSNET